MLLFPLFENGCVTDSYKCDVKILEEFFLREIVGSRGQPPTRFGWSRDIVNLEYSELGIPSSEYIELGIPNSEYTDLGIPNSEYTELAISRIQPICVGGWPPSFRGAWIASSHVRVIND